MNKIFSITALFSLLVFGFLPRAFAADESLTIATYYPSPNGVYGTMVTDRFAVGDMNNDGSINSNDVPALAATGQAFINTSLSIGTTTSLAKLHLKQSLEDAFATEWNPVHAIQIWGMGAGNMRMLLGVDDARTASYIQSAKLGIGGYNIALNPRGGGVAIGSRGGTIPVLATLHIHQPATSNVYNTEWSNTHGLQIWDSLNALQMGVDSTNNAAYLQSVRIGTSVTNLALNPRGGSVGINCAAPQAELHVRGLAGNGDLLLESTGGSRWTVSAENSGRFSIYDWNSGTSPVLIDGGAPVDSIHILSDGKVGIGTATPLTQLQVQGDSTVFGNLGVNLQSILNGQVTANAGVTVMGNLGVNLVSVLNGNVQANANAFKPGGGPWTATSDKRLKKKIRPLKNALEKMVQLEGVEFEWSEQKVAEILPGTQIGMIAQDVEKVFPQWVGTDDKGYKTLTPRGFEGLTVEAIKELQAEIEGLKKQIKILESKIASGKGK